MVQSVPDRNSPVDFTDAHFVYATALYLENLSTMASTSSSHSDADRMCKAFVT